MPPQHIHNPRRELLNAFCKDSKDISQNILNMSNNLASDSKDSQANYPCPILWCTTGNLKKTTPVIHGATGQTMLVDFDMFNIYKQKSISHLAEGSQSMSSKRSDYSQSLDLFQLLWDPTGRADLILVWRCGAHYYQSAAAVDST